LVNGHGLLSQTTNEGEMEGEKEDKEVNKRDFDVAREKRIA
jgi:hypothetical protein